MSYEERSENLRQTLRKATAQAHDRLDGTMRAVAGWSTIDDYARFLTLQYSARRPVEAWIDANAPDDLRPPAQTPLIAADLKQLGRDLPRDDIEFTAPTIDGGNVGDGQPSERSAALGAAWVLAGSSLGNRAILGEIKRMATREGWPAWPSTFLGDPHMLEFWKGLRAQIEDRAETDTILVAIASADCVFAHFLAHAETAAKPGAEPAPAQH